MRHTLGESCPNNPGSPPVQTSFTDHDRPGVYNSCQFCHSDQRTPAERLADLERQRKTSAERAGSSKETP